jgi:hypothetical protein
MEKLKAEMRICEVKRSNRIEMEFYLCFPWRRRIFRGAQRRFGAGFNGELLKFCCAGGGKRALRC